MFTELILRELLPVKQAYIAFLISKIAPKWLTFYNSDALGSSRVADFRWTDNERTNSFVIYTFGLRFRMKAGTSRSSVSDAE